MDYAAWAGIVVAIVGALGAQAYKSDRKWRSFFNVAAYGAAGVGTIFACAALGLGYAWMFPEKLEQTLLRAALLAGISCSALLVLWLAHWLREP